MMSGSVSRKPSHKRPESKEPSLPQEMRNTGGLGVVGLLPPSMPSNITKVTPRELVSSRAASPHDRIAASRLHRSTALQGVANGMLGAPGAGGCGGSGGGDGAGAAARSALPSQGAAQGSAQAAAASAEPRVELKKERRRVSLDPTLIQEPAERTTPRSFIGLTPRAQDKLNTLSQTLAKLQADELRSQEIAGVLAAASNTVTKFGAMQKIRQRPQPGDAPPSANAIRLDEELQKIQQALLSHPPTAAGGAGEGGDGHAAARTGSPAAPSAPQAPAGVGLGATAIRSKAAGLVEGDVDMDSTLGTTGMSDSADLAAIWPTDGLASSFDESLPSEHEAGGSRRPSQSCGADSKRLGSTLREEAVAGRQPSTKEKKAGGSRRPSKSGRADSKRIGGAPHEEAPSRRPSLSREIAADDEWNGSDISDEDVDRFVTELFVEYGTCRDDRGRPLMNNPGLRRFFRDFIGQCERTDAKADIAYADEIERQRDLHTRYDLSAGEARRGLSLKAFLVLLPRITPHHATRNTARNHFATYSGSARAMREHLSGNLLAA